MVEKKLMEKDGDKDNEVEKEKLLREQEKDKER